MERTENADGTVTHKATKPGEDLRNFDADGRFICNEDHPWSGNRDDAPHGVRHVDATTEDGTTTCPHCNASW